MSTLNNKKAIMMKKVNNNWQIQCKKTGLTRRARSINQAILIYEEMKGQGLKPKIYKLNKKI